MKGMDALFASGSVSKRTFEQSLFAYRSQLDTSVWLY
jgi:hypothetical protein